VLEPFSSTFGGAGAFGSTGFATIGGAARGFPPRLGIGVTGPSPSTGTPRGRIGRRIGSMGMGG